MHYSLIFSWLVSSLIISQSNAQVQDIDGNHYNTVQIGKQTWMEKNLQVSHFRNFVMEIPKHLYNAENYKKRYLTTGEDMYINSMHNTTN